MANLLAPSAIIFVNADLSAQVQSVIERQLFIDETMTGKDFDARVAVDPNYIDEIHARGSKILVIRPFNEYINRDKADLVLFCKNGLAGVEFNKYGPPGVTYQISSMYLSQIFNII